MYDRLVNITSFDLLSRAERLLINIISFDLLSKTECS